ncbi:MAG: carbonic anhydrase [Actinobacteria bacterium]|nr:carbonic anhydrase [Actinomycetota bacterium]
MIDELLEANERFADSYEGGELEMAPRRRLAVLTCMDARLAPERFLDLVLGEAHVIRNAGGRASDDALRSLVVSTRLLRTREVVVIHHTDCGMMSFDSEEFQQVLREETGADAAGIDFLGFSDLDDSVREDVERITTCTYMDEGISVSGLVYDVATGRLREVDAG